MEVFISGVTARALFVEGDEVTYIDADNPELEVRTTSRALQYVLAEAYDSERVNVVTRAEGLKFLLKKIQIDRGLRLLQLLLDRDESTDDRKEAAEYVSQLLATENVRIGICNWVYAIMSSEEELKDAIAILNSSPVNVATLLVQILSDQKWISRYRNEWERIPEHLFEGIAGKCQFEKKAIEVGAFRMLSQAKDDAEALNNAFFHCYLHLGKLPNGREIVGEWIKNTPRKRHRFEAVAEDEVEDSVLQIDEGGGERGREIYENVERQQAAIKQQLELGNLPLARKFARELVEWQLKQGNVSYVAKSLCRIGQEARNLGQFSVALEWETEATVIAPDDAWAFGQLGDTYLNLYRFNEALDAFKKGEALGDIEFSRMGIARIFRASGKLDDALKVFKEFLHSYPEHPEVYRAWAGHAEVLRDMWDFEGALKVYTEAVERFPEQSVLHCGRAAVLKGLGDLDDALAAYTAAIRMFPDSVVAYSGRADVLKVLGRLDDALSAYKEASELFVKEPVPVCGMADVLRTMGNLPEALECYANAKSEFSYHPAVYCGFAEVLRDMGRWEESLAEYDDAVQRFHFDIRCRGGRANILKILGRFEDALQAYDENVRDFPYDLFNLSGRANLLKELAQYEDALDAYDAIIERRPSYKSAGFSKAAVLTILARYDEAEALLPLHSPRTSAEWLAEHIRGMIALKKGQLSKAQDIFTGGLLNTPFYKERLFFERALAAVKIRQGEFASAIQLTKISTDPIDQVLRLHSFGQLGKRDEAIIAYETCKGNTTPTISILRDELAAKFGFGVVHRNQHYPENWILEKEAEILLQAA